MKLARTSCTLLGALILAFGATTAADARSTSSPKEWVSVFCGSIVTWGKTVKANSATLKTVMAGIHGKDGLSKARGKLVSYLDGLVQVSDTMASAVHHVGAPDIKHGAELQTGVENALGQVVTSFRAAAGKARHLPVNDAAAFRTQGIALGHAITASTAGINTAFSALSKLSTPELDNAARNDASCKLLNG